jgi:hypothetical protein
MITVNPNPAAHAGEAQVSPPATDRHFFINRPEVDADSLTELIVGNQWLRPGDAVYVAEIRRHVLTEADLDEAVRSVIGGAA